MSDDALPRWDMTPIFPSLTAPEFTAAFERLTQGIADLAQLFDDLGIRRRQTGAVTPEVAQAAETVITRLNDLMQAARVVGAYVNCFVTTDANDQTAKSMESRLDQQSVVLDKLMTRFAAWAGTTDIASLVGASPAAREHEYRLRRAEVQARRQMSESEEALAAELAPAAIVGWAKLHGSITALLTAEVAVDGAVKTLPMSSIRGLAAHPDRATRACAFEAEIRAWETVTVPVAAALNGVKGYQRTLRTKRGWEDDVEPTLFNNGIDATTLAAMQSACVDAFPDFRRYMSAKARALGVERLAWYDLGAPVGAAAKRWTWRDAEAFVIENFGRYSDRMREFAERALRERWIDAESRVGKEGGAYCSGLRPGESRILMNFNGSFTSVSTLAHELGHAYHNLNMRDRTPLQRATPSTMAETASIFCETLAFDAAMAAATDDERIVLLDTALERGLQVVVDIHSRFLFEKEVFARRGQRDLTVQEFCAIMTETQRATYGTDIDPLHPYMWAVKSHYYGPTFYNYPYTFGLLFGLGIYALYKRDPEEFRAQYDHFLSSTGMADVRTLGATFGVDTQSPAFWRASLDIIRGEIEEFVRLIP